MIPLTLKMCNFLSYRGETAEFDFSTIHIAVLSGDNGAGKSSFLEAMHWAVWGKARQSESDIIHIGETEMYVEFSFAVNQSRYRIHRSYRKSARGTSKLELYQAQLDTNQKWASITKGTILETQRFITENVVGMTYDVFENSAYLRQGKADAFTRLAPAQRRDILAEILEIDVYETYRERAKVHRDRLSKDEQRLTGEMSNVEAEVASIPILTSQLEDAETQRTTATQFLAYADTSLTLHQIRMQWTNATQQQREQHAVAQQLEADIAQIDTIFATRSEVEARYQQLLQLEADARMLRAQREQYDVLNEQRQTARATIERAQHDLDVHIATVQQKITLLDGTLAQIGTARERHDQLAERVAKLAENPPDVASIQQQQHQLQTQIATHQQALQRIRVLTNDLAQLQQRSDELHDSTAQWDAVMARLDECQQAQHRMRELDQQRIQQSDLLAATQAQRDIIRDRGIEMRDKKALLTINEPCPTCQTMMDEAHYAMAVSDFDKEIGQLREQYTALHGSVTQMKHALQDIDRALADCLPLVDEIGDLRRTLGKLEGARNELTRLHTQQHTLEAEYAALTQQDHAQALAQATDQRSQLDATFQAALAYQAEYHALDAQLANAQNELERLEQQATQKELAEAQLADALHQRDTATIAPDAQRQLHALDAQIATLAYDPVREREIQTSIDECAAVRIQYNELAVLDERHHALTQRRADVHQTLQTITQTIQSYDAEQQRLQQHMDDLRSHLAERDLTLQPQQMKQQAERELRHRSDLVAQLTVKYNHALDAQNTFVDQQNKRAKIATELGRYQTLEKAFSGRGIQAMIIREHAVPALEEETNRILSQMSDNQLHLHISTNTQTRAGHMIETIEINVSDASGTRQLEAFSGGEAFRISFALRIALSKLLHKRSGRPLETLIIDEGFGTQDASGRERLVEAINSVSAEFRTILVITHIQELRDLFPVQIAFQRTNGSSSWEVLS